MVSAWAQANRVVLGRFYLLQNSDPKQILEVFFDQALKEDPKNVSAYLAAGRLALEKHDYQLAAGTLQTFNGNNRWKRKFDEGLLALSDVGSWGYYARAVAERHEGFGEAKLTQASLV